MASNLLADQLWLWTCIGVVVVVVVVAVLGATLSSCVPHIIATIIIQLSSVLANVHDQWPAPAKAFQFDESEKRRKPSVVYGNSWCSDDRDFPRI